MQGGGRAKNLLLKLINAIYTKCGKNQGSLVFGIRSLTGMSSGSVVNLRLSQVWIIGKVHCKVNA